MSLPDFGRKLRFLRQQEKLTLAEVARRCGYDVQLLRAAETGQKPPTPDMLRRVAEIFGVKETYFKGGDLPPGATADDGGSSSSRAPLPEEPPRREAEVGASPRGSSGSAKTGGGPAPAWPPVGKPLSAAADKEKKSDLDFSGYEFFKGGDTPPDQAKARAAAGLADVAGPPEPRVLPPTAQAPPMDSQFLRAPGILSPKIIAESTPREGTLLPKGGASARRPVEPPLPDAADEPARRPARDGDYQGGTGRRAAAARMAEEEPTGAGRDREWEEAVKSVIPAIGAARAGRAVAPPFPDAGGDAEGPASRRAPDPLLGEVLERVIALTEALIARGVLSREDLERGLRIARDQE